jgi:uncharacterized membrane protein YidH (DUF202 family)
VSPERDPGLAAERTTLAWQRTGLSALALAALAVHSFQDRLHLAVPVATVLAVVGATAYRTGGAAGPTPLRTAAASSGSAGTPVSSRSL